jgi:hypothetical protein
MKIRLYNIKWNTDDEIVVKNNLPSEVIIENPTEEQLNTPIDEYDEDLADAVSDMYGGFPIYEYNVEILRLN